MTLKLLLAPSGTRRTALLPLTLGPLTLAVVFAGGCNSSPSPQAATPAQAGTASTAPAGTAPGTQPSQYPTSNPQPAPAPGQVASQGPSPRQNLGTAAYGPAAQASGAYPANSANQARASAMPPPVPRSYVIPAGTALRVRLDQSLSSNHNQAGDTFSATVESPVIVDGETIIKRGSTASGTVIGAKGQGHIKGAGVLAIRLDRVSAGGRSYLVSTNSIERVAKGKGRRSAEFAGGGAGLGALIGGLAGGGKGALIGGLAGAGAGTAGGAMTGNHDLVLPAETMLTFRLTRDARVE